MVMVEIRDLRPLLTPVAPLRRSSDGSIAPILAWLHYADPDLAPSRRSATRGFLQQCLSNPAILATLNWDGYKRQIASDLVDYLVRGEDKHLGDLTKICYELCSITTFTHLKQQSFPIQV